MGLTADDGTSTLYVANFDFDDRLAKPAMTTLPKRLRVINARLAPLLEPLLRPGDALVQPGDPVPNAGRFERIEPWGVEPTVLKWLRRIGARPDVLERLPDPAAVRTANSRRFQFEAERALSVLPAGADLCDSPRDLYSAADRLPGGWVMKGEYGGSGRAILFGAGRPSDRMNAWIATQTLRGCVTIEPRDESYREYSAHFTVTDRGVTFDGVCWLHSTPTGRFRSVEPLPRTDAVLAECEPVWTAVAERARARGHRGFLGIDAAAGFSQVNRPVRDVNARWTMGRVALTLGRRVSNP